jgi:hypothetical protein
MTRLRTLVILAVVSTLAATYTLAQRSARPIDERTFERVGLQDWKNAPGFEHDVFTFVRIRYSSAYGGRRRGGGGWYTDAPDAEMNFSFRLQQLTTLKVNPRPIFLDLTDERLFDYPFIYIVEPGSLEFEEAEVAALRKYLLNGGFLMVDDFWGGDEYDNFHREIKRVFPDREVVDLPLEHPIFHCVYDLKEKPQLPSVGHAEQGLKYEWRPGPDDGSEVHYRAIFDDKGRLMVIICHNTDNGDGWEREGENHDYFKNYSEKYAYPMGINIVFYAMTH